MKSELKDRMAKAIQRSGKTKAELARHCGVTRPAVSKWCNGNSKSIDAALAVKAATFLGVSAEWLATGRGELPPEGDPVGAIYDEDEVPAGYVNVPEYRVEVGAGDCGEPSYEEETESKRALYRQEWFSAHGVKVENCKRLKVRGDSMYPILFDGDTIMCDCTPNQQISPGKIYAFCFGNGLRVKRLFPRLNGGMLVRSENPNEPDEEIIADEMSKFRLIGRVIDRSGSGPF